MRGPHEQPLLQQECTLPHAQQASVSPAFQSSKPQRSRLFLLCIFSFLRVFKPSEPFLVDFLVDCKGFTNEQIFDHVFPVFVYAQAPCLLILGMFSERCGYKLGLLLGAVCSLTTVTLTLLAQTLLLQQLSQVTVALAFSSDTLITALGLHAMPPAQSQLASHATKVGASLSTAA
ncbi:hypothetical protein CYMTET_30183 [Cymbomonas tetramitiformis]|uniref:Uncharacterized protein n=1 Tax=Cymbomonas tetramitiformis TaxID=36881 RepID=A0AAE0KUF6_9CHLO|nr:hypothetical protein CYMTET_30183 [Cymbomonas tetramitiformis]